MQSLSETSGLRFMREEEKLARDVHLSLHEAWGVRAFKKIARQEKVHMKAVRTLLRKYDIDDPAKGAAIGVFQNAQVQALYAELVELGSLSLVDAFEVGALVEEMDINDLNAALGRADNEDILTLYQNLLEASRNHLRAFDRLFESQGGEYDASCLSQTEYDAIADSAKEKGGVLDAAGELICGSTQTRQRGASQ